ncbi:hypothetical protein ACNKHV_24335 [Shigella flexneri]
MLAETGGNAASRRYRLMNPRWYGTTTGVASSAYKPALRRAPGTGETAADQAFFEGVTPNLDTITALPVQGLHVDLIHGKDDVAELHKRLPSDWLLSAGLIDGRNVWRANLFEKYAQIKEHCRQT